MASPTSRDAILLAARDAIAARGPGKLTLVAVAAAAGVSRPTVYRWFPSKDDLLAAITDHEKEHFALGLQAAVDAKRNPTTRLEAALRYLVTYLDGSLGEDPIGVDPGFALASLDQSLGPAVTSFVELVGDGLGQVAAVRAGVLSRDEAAELFVRLAYSHYLFPHPDPEALLTTMRSFAGLAGRAARVAG